MVQVPRGTKHLPDSFQLRPGEQELLQCPDLLLPAPPAAPCSAAQKHPVSPDCWAAACTLKHRLNLRVIDAVRSERMVGLMPQWGTVLGSVVVGLWHVYDCFIIQGYCISIEGPVSAVYLVCKAKNPACVEGSTLPAVWKQTFKYMQLRVFLYVSH